MSEPAIRSIPLDRLELSPANVRKTSAARTALDELKASIAAHGLLENLVARPLGPDGGGVERYAVIAGGRRSREDAKPASRLRSGAACAGAVRGSCLPHIHFRSRQDRLNPDRSVCPWRRSTISSDRPLKRTSRTRR